MIPPRDRTGERAGIRALIDARAGRRAEASGTDAPFGNNGTATAATGALDATNTTITTAGNAKIGGNGAATTTTWVGKKAQNVAAATCKQGASQATRIVDLAQAAGVELWHTGTGEAYISIPADIHVEHHRLEGKAVRGWLARLHHCETGRPPGGQAIKDALSTLSGIACYDGAQHDVHVRVAAHGDAVYLDVGDPLWRAIEITADGWSIVARPPLRFRRGITIQTLPIPEPGGRLDALRDIVHVGSEDDWRLIVAWLVGSLQPRGPYPLLAVDGEQGAGKSTGARLVRRMIDPSSADLRAEPREIRDLMVAASGGWIIAFDNVSHLPPWLSDALCRISTGGALSTRMLYTDGDEYIIEAVRPSLITGIAQVVVRGDLQDRSISLTLPAVSDDKRRTEVELWREYERIHPTALGALLDAVACALRRREDIRVPQLPRMADFGIWITAAEPALGYQEGAMLAAYTRNGQEAIEQALEGDPVAVAIRALSMPYEGSAAELLSRITPPARPKGWPESPRGLSGALRRLAPQLRRVGINVTFPKRQAERRRIVISEAGVEPS